MEKRAADDERIPVSLSSEARVKRWFGVEVLEHNSGAIDLSRAAQGLPLLYNHDTDSPIIGRLEDVALRKDKKLGAMARFSKNPRAQEVRADVEDGILTDMSLGFRINEWVEERKTASDEATYRITNWTPMEGSIVPIPADHTVGVQRSDRFASDVQSAVGKLRQAITLHEGHMDGSVATDEASQQKMMNQMKSALLALDDAGMEGDRSAEQRAAPPGIEGPRDNAPMKGKELRMPEDQKAPAPDAGAIKAAVDGALEDRKRDQKIMADVAKLYGMESRLGHWIEKDMSLEQVRADIETEKTRKAAEATPAGNLDLPESDAKSYNVCRAIMAVANGTWNRDGGLEREVSDAIAKRSGTPARGFYLPLTLQTRASITGQIVGTSSLGGAAVQTTLQSLIEILRNRLVTRRAGARFLTGLTDTISFPRQITANTFTWTGENPTAANALSALTLNNLTMAPKTGMSSSAFSRQVLIQSTPDMQNLVLDDIAQVIAVGVDSAGINGTGTLQPTGVRNTSGIGNRTLGAAGAALAWADLVGLETDVSVGNADLGTLAYITNAVTRGKLKTTLKTTTAGSAFLWENGNDPGLINGYNAYASNQVPSNLTQGTSTTICSSIIFGNWNELLIGLWGNAVDLIIDPYTSKNQNMIEVTGITMIDVGVRHAVAFSKSDAVLAS